MILWGKYIKGEKITMDDHKKLQVDTLDLYSLQELHKMIELVELIVEQRIYDDYLNNLSDVYELSKSDVLKKSLQVLK